MDKPVLEFRDVDKRFFGAPVLRQVSFPLQRGTILGLIGENGAGKSTLMNILGGVLPADGGQMLLEERPFSPSSPADAAQAGVALVHQELNLFGNLSVAENLFLLAFPQQGLTGLGLIDRRELRRQATDSLDRVGISLDPDTPLALLSPGERQLVEIAKALQAHPKILVLDEPTTSLTRPEIDRLFAIVNELRSKGVSIVYISHNLSDVRRLCDNLVVLRDGAVQAFGPSGDFTIERMIQSMVGREMGVLFPKRTCAPQAEILLEVRGLTQPGMIQDVSFSLRRSELLGVAGLMGSGRTELARILFGLDPLHQGQILVRGKPLQRPSPSRCIARGMAFLTEDRRSEGLLMEGGVVDNVALASLDRFAATPLGILRGGLMRRQSSALAESLGVECRDVQRQSLKTLSGGNQQKVVLAKWLLRDADILILDEPTRGVDVGAKHDIYVEINRALTRGACVLMISSELEELVGMCDRIIVMRQGEVESVVEKAEFDRSEMLRSAFGEERLR